MDIHSHKIKFLIKPTGKPKIIKKITCHKTLTRLPQINYKNKNIKFKGRLYKTQFQNECLKAQN
jgi:hypothetical protein